MKILKLFVLFCMLHGQKCQETNLITTFESLSSLADRLLHNPAERRGKLPQTLSILMNFDQYGTSSVHLSGGDGVFWSDSGNCPHGQTFDPYKYVCRDMFCVEGYVLGPNGCMQDPDRDLHSNSTTVYPQKLLVELTLSHKMCLFIENVDTYNCNHPYLTDLAMDQETGEWTRRLGVEFLTALSQKMRIRIDRLQNFEVISREITTKVVTSVIEDYFDNNDNCSSSSNRNYNHKPLVSVTSNGVQIRQSEKIRVKFRIMEPKPEEDLETLEVYFQLITYGINKELLVLFGRRTTLTNIIQSKSDEDLGWCDSPGDKMETYFDGFRVLASFGNRTRYFVHVNATDTIYSTGYYYMFIMMTTNNKNNQLNFRLAPTFHHMNYPMTLRYNPIEEEPDLFPWQIDYRQFNLTDVTEFVISNKSSSVKTSAILATCDRAPKIRIFCVNFTTIRVSICEFNYVPQNRSFCWPTLDKCYSVDEYEFDSEEPDRYLRICNFDSMGQVVVLDFRGDAKTVLEHWYSVTLPAWLSFILTIISTTLMIICLITFALFNELRNIPAWNIINLTMALTLAQISFIASSFLNDVDHLLCFVNSLTIHYAYLASFFWMNVIAFDLYRNFRDKNSHVLIHSLTLKDRLPKYALYAWLAPLLIVILALIVDLSFMSHTSPFRPCYAGYLPGCQIKTITTFESEPSQRFNQTSCEEYRSLSLASTYLQKSCWIRNGRANLVFFGLPIGFIIFINAVFYTLTIISICKKRRAKSQLRRFSRTKLPSQVKFYTQMGIIMGFTWISGFLITTTSHTSHDILNLVLVYFFLVLNSSMGVFIFFAFICKQEVGELYVKRYRLIFCGRQTNKNKLLHQTSLNGQNNTRCKPVLTLEASDLDTGLKRRSSNSMKTLSTETDYTDYVESFTKSKSESQLNELKL